MLIMTLYVMLFLHIVDDFHVQGILASMKQKEWWQKNAPHTLYCYDHITALVIHSISWAMVIMIPVCWAYVDNVNPLLYTISVVVNATIHGYVDHMKADQRKISLTTDQLIHFIQVFLTWVAFSI